MPNFRPRISLLTALLLMTIVGMAVVIVQLWREVEPLRAANRQLRKERGYLSIDDPKKLYAIEAVADDPGTRRFRVYVPKETPYRIHTRLRAIPGHDLSGDKKAWLASLLKSRAGTSESIPPGEHTIDVKVRPGDNENDKDNWNLIFNIQGHGPSSVGTKIPWLSDRRAWSQGGDLSFDHQLEVDPNIGFVLFALLKGKVTETSKGGYSMENADLTKDNEGLMIWIAPAPGTSPNVSSSSQQ